MPERNLNPRRTGFISEMVIQAKLVIRLMKDNRINPLLKILPFGGLIYLVIPDILIGPIDDAAILFAGSYLFLEFCPQAIVQEHLQILLNERESGIKKVQDEENIIDADFHDVED